VVIDHQGTREEIPAEGVFLLTGYHPDVDLMRTAGIHVDDVTLAPELNMETFETNVSESVHRRWCDCGEEDREYLHRERAVSMGRRSSRCSRSACTAISRSRRRQ
jgi:hypothetical protein